MTLLEKLDFRPIGKSGYSWLWHDTFYILIKPPNYKHKLGWTQIIKNLNTNFTVDKRESFLFQGSYCFDNDDFAYRLLKNIGILEKINGTKIIELKDTKHFQVLTDLGFIEIVPNTWTKNIFLVSLRPPRFDTDRGKCLILKKPNFKNLIKGDRPANVVYKGRYFFEDSFFTEILFDKIGFYLFDSEQQNKTYDFNRETMTDSENFIEDEFLQF